MWIGYVFWLKKFVVFIFVVSSEQMRTTDKQLKKTGRDIDRDRRELEKEEKKLVSHSSTLKTINYFSLLPYIFNHDVMFYVWCCYRN